MLMKSPAGRSASNHKHLLQPTPDLPQQQFINDFDIERIYINNDSQWTQRKNNIKESEKNHYIN